MRNGQVAKMSFLKNHEIEDFSLKSECCFSIIEAYVATAAVKEKLLRSCELRNKSDDILISKKKPQVFLVAFLTRIISKRTIRCHAIARKQTPVLSLLLHI